MLISEKFGSKKKGRTEVRPLTCSNHLILQQITFIVILKAFQYPDQKNEIASGSPAHELIFNNRSKLQSLNPSPLQDIRIIFLEADSPPAST